MKKLITLIILALLVSSCSSSDSPLALPIAKQVLLKGAGDLGIFDPSLARDPDTTRLWMSYSSVNTSSYYASDVYWKVSIRLAYSDDNGLDWTDAGIDAAPASEILVGPLSGGVAANSLGIWQNETSSLVYDPSAPPAERWKLFWFQYLNANLQSYFGSYSWVALKMAATPQELSSATAIKLFGGAGLEADGSNAGSPVFAPIGGAPAIMLNTDLTQASGSAKLSDLSSCAFAEPGLYASSAGLYLSIFCADTSTLPITQYLVDFSCAAPCDISSATSWQYNGRLLTPADALVATGHHHFQAPDIVENNGEIYLLVTPVDTSTGERYDGCRLYQFSDINSNQLVRNNGSLVELARIDGDTGTHNGACTGYSGIQGGILYSQFEPYSKREPFKIYRSMVDLP